MLGHHPLMFGDWIPRVMCCLPSFQRELLKNPKKREFWGNVGGIPLPNHHVGGDLSWGCYILLNSLGSLGLSVGNIIHSMSGYRPASSTWPFDSPKNGGHLTPEKVTLNTQKGHREVPGTWKKIATVFCDKKNWPHSPITFHCHAFSYSSAPKRALETCFPKIGDVR